MGIALVLALLNLAMVKKRGKRALIMVGALLMFSVSIQLDSMHAPRPAVIASWCVVFALLIADIFFKIRNGAKR